MEIELYSKLNGAADLKAVGEMWGKSGIFGNDKVEFGIIALMTCAQERITPVQFARTYDIIGGKVKKKAVAAYAEFRAKGAKVEWIKTGEDGIEARAKITFEGQTTEHSYTIDQARKQQLVKKDGNWDKTPGNMLRARLLSNAIAMLAPEIYAGESDDEQERESKPLLKSEPATAFAESPRVEVKPANVVDVQTVSSTVEPVVVTASAAPAADRPFSPADARLNPENGRLSAETTQAVQLCIGEQFAAKALEWLKARGWIKTNLSELSLERAKRILSKPTSEHPWAKEGAK